MKPDDGRARTAISFGLALLMLAATAVFTWLAVREINARRWVRTDLAELGNVRYGLLNADRWVEQIVPIISAKIEVFDLTKTDRRNLRRNVEGILVTLIGEVQETIRSDNLKQGATGKLRQAFIDKFVNFDDFRRRVPEYAKDVIARLETPDAKATVRQYLTGVVMRAAGGTGGTIEFTAYNAILRRYGCADGAACRDMLQARVRDANARIPYLYVPALLAGALAFVAVWAGGLRRTRIGIMILVAVCVVLLAGGLTTPTIEIEAKISSLTFRILGEPVIFADQVLYFQTKSILDVVTLMLRSGEFMTAFVGVLVLLFSVIQPTAKLIASAIYTFDLRPLSRGRAGRMLVGLIRALALKSSKWSMADVMVVAFFMVYFGFDRVVANSLEGLRSAGGSVKVITTSGTSLEPGYFLFIGFCLASLLLASTLDRPRPDAYPND